MFFTKSETDLGKSKSDAQHRIVCDWLRNIDKKLTRISRELSDILENENHAEGVARELDDK